MTTPHPDRHSWKRGTLAALVAAALNLGVARSAARHVDASAEFIALQPGPVVSVTVAAVLAGTAGHALLVRLTPRPARPFLMVVAFVALASLAAPISLATGGPGAFAGVTPAAALSLIPLHLIPAAVLLLALVERRAVSA